MGIKINLLVPILGTIKDQNISVMVCLGPTSTRFLSTLTGKLMESFPFGFELDAHKCKKRTHSNLWTVEWKMQKQQAELPEVSVLTAAYCF